MPLCQAILCRKSTKFVQKIHKISHYSDDVSQRMQISSRWEVPAICIIRSRRSKKAERPRSNSEAVRFSVRRSAVVAILVVVLVIVLIVLVVAVLIVVLVVIVVLIVVAVLVFVSHEKFPPFCHSACSQ